MPRIISLIDGDVVVEVEGVALDTEAMISFSSKIELFRSGGLLLDVDATAACLGLELPLV